MQLRSQRRSIMVEESGEETSPMRSCKECNTTKTPLWRKGADGKNTLCNACGLRRKKRLTKVLDAESRAKKGKKTTPRKPRIHTAGSTTNRGRGLLGIETVMKKRRSYNRKMWTMEKDQQLAVAALLELAGSALVKLSDSNFY
ncbi:PREDICTED: GATA transcription factor 23-like [Fragaria vesca subsp. vesca]|uniref:GATA transcription factor 23-like n=1 Tax=Fragaria vesca subsp. vesca TaxID=101020 RepID=UPI0002C34D3B|nr:PREDICTED: GATA transcription factor 23-like [Fragaria vesca subsp. vesca]